MQIITLSFIGLFLGYLATWLFEVILRSNRRLYNRYYRHHEILFGYHVHHSTYGLIFFAVAVIFLMLGQEPSAIFDFWFGLGIIIKHSVLDHRVVFIEKQR